MKQRLSALMSRLGGIVCRNPVPKESILDDTLLSGSTDSRGVLSFPNAEILQYGVVRLQKRYCLDLDYGSKAALGSWKHSGQRISKAVALWSHPWMGYYHWIIDVLPKICMMQESLGADLGGASLCYPSWLPSIEDESLLMLGLGRNPIIDTSTEGGVHADMVYAVRLPGWYQIPHGAYLLRERLTSTVGPGLGKRIYVSRTGRRQITNEEEVWELLKAKGFSFVEDRPRSLREQIAMFHESEVVVAPHGAALANILWCRPGTCVLELANKSYCPPFYKNLAEVCGLRHSAVLAAGGRSHWTRMEDSVTVNLMNLKEHLDREVVISMSDLR